MAAHMHAETGLLSRLCAVTLGDAQSGAAAPPWFAPIKEDSFTLSASTPVPCSTITELSAILIARAYATEHSRPRLPRRMSFRQIDLDTWLVGYTAFEVWGAYHGTLNFILEVTYQ